MFLYKSDRHIPSRKQIRNEFLQKKNEEDFDISLPENNVRTMKKVQYQNKLRSLFNEQKENECNRKTYGDDDSEKEKKVDASLIHLDWSCKLINIREKFLPDFETLEKKNFANIRKCVCLYSI